MAKELGVKATMRALGAARSILYHLAKEADEGLFLGDWEEEGSREEGEGGGGKGGRSGRQIYSYTTLQPHPAPVAVALFYLPDARAYPYKNESGVKMTTYEPTVLYIQDTLGSGQRSHIVTSL